MCRWCISSENELVTLLLYCVIDHARKAVRLPNPPAMTDVYGGAIILQGVTNKNPEE